MNSITMDGKLVPLLRFSSLTILLLLAVSVSAQTSDILVPKYDNVANKLVYFEIKKVLHMSCNITSGSGVLEWRKDNKEISTIESLKDRFEIHETEHTLTLKRPDESDAGNYSCSIKGMEGTTRDIIAYAKVVVRQPENTAVVEGEKLTLSCTGYGSDVKFNWTIGNVSYSQSTETVELKTDFNEEKKVHIATLALNDTKLEDRGEYTCIGYNLISDSKSTTLVRVKGKYAALWPFLGICAEVFVLCAIILIYEKRRNKTDLDESDTDQSPDQKNDHHLGKDSDVRQRK